jgi:hypothetical protein
MDEIPLGIMYLPYQLRNGVVVNYPNESNGDVNIKANIKI